MSQSLPRRFGDYLLLHLVGRGGNGAAYLASPLGVEGLPNPLIVKTMTPAAAERESDRRRFQHEAQLAVAARVPVVATVYDAGLVGDTPYIAMEFVRGMTMGSLLKTLSARSLYLRAERALDLALSGLRSLQALQEAVDAEGQPLQVVHRDISPRNLMLDPRGEVRLLDLGLGRSLLSELHTRTGSILGTPGYMSPEQVLGQKTTQASDVYAFAVITWELFAMQRYIARGPLPEVLKRTVQRAYESPARHRPGLPAELDRVLAGALALDARQRFLDAAQFLDALSAVREPLRRAATALDGSGVELAQVYAPELTDEHLQALLALPEDEAGPEPVRTTIYARRAPETITEAASASGLSTTAGSAPSVTDTAALSATEAPRTPPGRPDRHRGWLGAVAAVTMVGALGLGVALVLRAWPPPRPPPVPAPIRVEPKVRALAAPPTDEPPATPHPTPSLGPAERAPARGAPRGAPGPARAPAATATPAPSPTVETSPEPDVQARLERIMARGEALKRARPDRAAEIEEVLSAAVFESVAGDTPAARRKLSALAARLERLGADEP